MTKYITFNAFAIAIFLGTTLVSSPLIAQTDDAYARYFGDGLRHLGEGRYSEAIEQLFRAYAIDTKPETLSLIIGAYDRMGFCDAAAAQRELYAERHPVSDQPGLDRCTSVGELRVECDRPDATVAIDGRFEIVCGQTTTLPVGQHRLAAAQAAPAVVNVAAEQTASATITFAQPEAAGSTPHIEQIAESSATVDRLLGELGYTVYMSQDGLYRIVIHPGGLRGEAVPLRPEVLRLCDTGEQFDRETRSCAPSESMQIHKME